MKKLIQKAGCLLSSLIAFAGFILLVLILLFLFISPIAHWAIEKYAPEYTGRKVVMRDIYINPLTGRMHIEGLKVLEQKSDQSFIYAGQTHVRLNIPKLFTGFYQVDSLSIDTLNVQVIQDGYAFNFDDLMTTLLAEDSISTEPSTDTLQYVLGKTSLQHVELVYLNKYPEVKLELSDGDVLIPKIAWNNNVIHIEARTIVNNSGSIEAAMDYNLANYDYHLALQAKEVSTKPLFPYFGDYLNSTKAEGLFSAKMQLHGNIDEPTLIALKGKMQLDAFELTDAYDDKQLGWKQFSIEIDSINTGGNLYRFDNIVLSDPYLLFTLTPNGDNLSGMMRVPDTTSAQLQTIAGTEGTPAGVVNPFVMFAELVGEIAEQYSKNEYGMNRFAIENGTIVYNDFLTNEKFSVLFENFNAQSASFNDSSKMVKFDISTLMNRYGDVKAKLAVDNTNYKDFDLKLNINSLTMSIFNPYTKYYVAHPFWRGDISFSNTTSVKDGALKSNNRLIVKQIKVGDKIKSDSAFNIPVKLAVAILRDRKGNIDLEIPIEGSLKDPDYKWGKAAFKVLKNLLVKAVTAPFDLLARSIGGNPEDLKMITFDPLQDSISQSQRKNLDAMSKVLTDKPEMTLKLVFRYNPGLERDEMAVRKALSQWIIEKTNNSSLSVDGSLPADSLRLYSANDSLFGQWLISKTKLTSPAISLQDKCLKVIGGKEAADAMVNELNKRRDVTVSEYLQKAGITTDRFTIMPNLDENLNMNTPLPVYDASFDVK